MPRYVLRFGDYEYTLSNVADDRSATRLLGALRSGFNPVTPIAVDELLAPLQFNPKRWPSIEIDRIADPE